LFFFRSLSKEKEREKEKEQKENKEEEGAETQKNSLFFFSLVPAKERRNPKKKNRATCSLASASFTLKKHKKTGEKGENERSSPPRERDEREEERSGHHTSHAQQHTISSWHSDKP
jgi:hypothetical protein